MSDNSLKMCPDCGSRLQPVNLGEGTGEAYRCSRCGGFFTDAWTVNRMRPDELEDWEVVEAGPEVFAGRTNKCPNDGEELRRFVGESVPGDVVVMRCGKCGWWWWPRDALFRYKPAQAAKINYFKLWGRSADLATLALPVMGILILALGLGAGISLVQERAIKITSAGGEITNFEVTKVAGETVVVTFVSASEFGMVEWRVGREGEWRKARVEREGKVNVVRLPRGAGEEYEMRVGGKMWRFEAE